MIQLLSARMLVLVQMKCAFWVEKPMPGLQELEIPCFSWIFRWALVEFQRWEGV